ncbi:MAG: carboxypeptidase-like regulatory domain-containing protein [Candidatus Moranbacteria bacterium]|nr:carboxypeptidase-like regulatory domain-containing protein [Candidatus Moranbacteria bacterium]
MLPDTKYQILNTKYKAFMLIEAMTVLFIFALITITFYSVFSVGTRYIQDAKNRLGALAVSNERMEIVRNLAYDSIGTDHGTIHGNIPQDQDVTENAHQYHIHTEVDYIDDPFDGIGYADTVWFEDYKRVIITTSWSGATNTSENVQITSRFVPPGKEVQHVGDGILSVNIFSDQPGGAGIPDSKVTVVNADTHLNTYQMTDDSGNATFMGDRVTNSIQKYQITVEKSGYETVATMPPYPLTPLFNPIDVHASVVTGTMNVANIVQNKLANIKISTVDYLDAPISGATFHLSGGRKLGTNVADPFAAVYNFDQSSTTDSGGEKLFSSISPGNYAFSLTGSTLSDYVIISTTPVLPFSLLSSVGTLDAKIKLASKTATSLLVSVFNTSSTLPIAGAKVRLTNAALSYDKELTSTSDGKVFFPDSSDPFLPETYHMKITATGYSNKESDVTITAGSLKTESVGL